MPTLIEVYADIACPFTHIGLRRFVEQRHATGRDDLKVRVRPWPLEWVNGKPLEPLFIEEEVNEIRPQVAADLFTNFDAARFPSSSLAAHALVEAAYDSSLDVGEQISLELRDLLFEQGTDVSDPTVLAELGHRHGVTADADLTRVRDAYEHGVQRGVQGSPHFFIGDADFFCPGLRISRDDEDHLQVAPDHDAFDRFMAAAL